jgi:hypothetical protein
MIAISNLIIQLKIVKTRHKILIFDSKLRVDFSKNLLNWNLGVSRSSRDHFFRIPHAKIGE